jgi:hypothetical protein
MRGTVGPSSSLADGELASFYGREVVLWRENYPPSLNQIWIIEEGKIMSALNRRLVLDLYGNPDPLSVMHQGARVIVDRARDSLGSSQAWDILANCR